MNNDLHDQVRQIIAKAGRIPVESVVLDRSLAELGLDSLDGLTLAFQLEDAFHVQIPDDCLDRMQPVSVLIDRMSTLLPRDTAVRVEES